jgi:hypothetical protein
LASEPQPVSDIAIAAAQADSATDDDIREKFTTATLPPRHAVTHSRPLVGRRAVSAGDAFPTASPATRARENVAPLSLSDSIPEDIRTRVA